MPPDSRYARVAGLSRRSFLAAVVGGATGLLAACARSDEEVFADLDSDGRLSADPGSSTAGTGATGRPRQTLRVQDPDSVTSGSNSAPTASAEGSTGVGADRTATHGSSSQTTQDTTGSTTSAPAATAGTGGGAAVAAGRDLLIAFTYQQVTVGKNVPPYVAVWLRMPAATWSRPWPCGISSSGGGSGGFPTFAAGSVSISKGSHWAGATPWTQSPVQPDTPEAIRWRGTVSSRRAGRPRPVATTSASNRLGSEALTRWFGNRSSSIARRCRSGCRRITNWSTSRFAWTDPSPWSTANPPIPGSFKLEVICPLVYGEAGGPVSAAGAGRAVGGGLPCGSCALGEDRPDCTSPSP